MKNSIESKLVAAFAVGFIFSGAWSVAFAKDRTLIVLESSVVATGADVTVTADGGCEGIVRIAPIADQRPAKVRRWSKRTCDAVKVELTNLGKADQGLE